MLIKEFIFYPGIVAGIISFIYVSFHELVAKCNVVCNLRLEIEVGKSRILKGRSHKGNVRCRKSCYQCKAKAIWKLDIIVREDVLLYKDYYITVQQFRKLLAMRI